MLALQTLGSVALSETVQVHVHTVGYGMGAKDSDGWTPVKTIPDGYICPAVVNKYNWDKAAAGQFAESSDEFYLRQIDNTIQAKRKGHNADWGMNLAFACHRGGDQDAKCHTLVVGGSHDAGVATYDASNEAWSKAFAVPAGYTCPAFVTKHNWHKAAAGMHADIDDKFHVRQSETTVHVRRDGGDKNWGMVLAFDCCVPDSTATKYQVGDECHPSKCEDWECTQWCACFEQSVEDAGQYAAPCAVVDADACSC